MQETIYLCNISPAHSPSRCIFIRRGRQVADSSGATVDSAASVAIVWSRMLIWSGKTNTRDRRNVRTAVCRPFERPGQNRYTVGPVGLSPQQGMAIPGR
jgi:hypothetical protein